MDKISQTPFFLNLTHVRIEVLNQTRQEMTLVNHNSLCCLILEWIKRQITEESLTSLTLQEKTHMLYLAIDNSLQDCSSLPTGTKRERRDVNCIINFFDFLGDICDTELVQDYKKLSLKNTQKSNKNKRKASNQPPSKPRVLIYSREIGEELQTVLEPDWKLIGSTKVGEHTFLALMTLRGKLATLSVQLR